MKIKNRLFYYLTKSFRTFVVVVGLFLCNFSSLNGQNLLLNGGFESSTIVGSPDPASADFDSWVFDPSGRGGADILASTDVVEGSKAVLLVSNGKKGKLMQTVSGVDSSKTYVYSAYVKTTETTYEGQTFKLLVNTLSSSGSNNGNKNRVYNVTQEYVRYGIPVIVNANYLGMKAQVQCHQNGVAGEFLIDDVSLVETSTFQNLGFEDGINYIWKSTLAGSAIVVNETADVQEGLGAVKMTLTADVDTAKISNEIRVPVSIGKSYSISAWLKESSNGAVSDSIEIIAKAYNDDHDLIGGSNEKFELSDSFAKYSYTYTPAADVAYMSIAFQVTDVVGEYVIDNVAVDETIATASSIVEGNAGWVVYPNPAKSFIAFNNREGSANRIKIFDTTGKMVLAKNNCDAMERIDIEALNQGMYIVEVVSEDNTYVTKFLKK